jgi:glycosyltransferase involved in cell wall biosynthesis
MSDRHALVISYHAPQPDRDSGSRRVFNFLELLQQGGWRVVVYAADGAGAAHDVRRLTQRGIAVYDGYASSIDEVLRERPFELALIAYWPNAERYLSRLRTLSPMTRIIVDSVDLHFLRESRELLGGTLAARGRGLTDVHGSRFAAELNAYASADVVLTVSQKEADLVNDLVWDHRLAHAAPDFEDIPARFDPFSRRSGIVCVGSFQHPPNIDAVGYLCREILPRLDPAVLAKHPVWIVGNNPNETVREFARGLDNVCVVGWVPSVLPYLARARISVVPLRFGAGTKRKLVQALAAGTPSVSTSIGAEGLEIQHGKHVLIADDPDEFAGSIARLLNDGRLWTRLARAGRACVKKTNSEALARRRFAEALDAAFDRSPKRVPFVIRHARQKRTTPEEYTQLVERLRQKLPSVVPATSSVLVVSKGDERLVQLNGSKAEHFPQDETGKWAGFHPKTSADAIAHLEALRSRGADVLVFPMTSFWWLEHYQELTEYLQTNYVLMHRDEDCEVFGLWNGDRNGRKDALLVTPGEPAAGEDPGRADDAKLIAFYLPQFHPIPENDDWWGKGFTEWRNVARGRPLFPGHYQPHVPADLGFYDLRLPDARERQAELARSAGIHGFCYHHYWFHGKRLLHRPFDEVLGSGEPDFPFALCWANDPWSRRWDGRDDELLQAQTYSAEDDLAHIRWLLPALSDHRAITVDGKPLFLVYRASHLPEPARTCEIWRGEVERAGLRGIHLVAVETAWELGWDATQMGFDAKVLFQPQFGWLITHVTTKYGRVAVPGKEDLQVYDYDVVRAALSDLEPVDYRRYETVFPGWDNTARVGERAVVMQNATPSGYEEWLTEAVARARVEPEEHRIVFLNAWNEWAEGCHLEPDLEHGRAYLDATLRAQKASVAAETRSLMA